MKKTVVAALLCIVLLVFTTALASCGPFLDWILNGSSDDNSTDYDWGSDYDDGNSGSGGSGSSSSSGSSGSSSSSNKVITIELINGSQVLREVVICNQENEVPTLTKSGYYFKGYYDSEYGGTQYFDNKGKSTSNWTYFPSCLYAQWGDIRDLSYTTQYNGDRLAWSLSSLSVSVDLYAYATLKLSDEFVSAIESNPDRNVEVTVSFEAWASVKTFKSRIWLSERKKDAGGQKLGMQEITLGESRSNYTITVTAKASLFSKGSVYFYAEYITAFGFGYADNLVLSVSFV